MTWLNKTYGLEFSKDRKSFEISASFSSTSKRAILQILMNSTANNFCKFDSFDFISK